MLKNQKNAAQFKELARLMQEIKIFFDDEDKLKGKIKASWALLKTKSPKYKIRMC